MTDWEKFEEAKLRFREALAKMLIPPLTWLLNQIAKIPGMRP